MSCFGAGCGKGSYTGSKAANIFPQVDAGLFRQKVDIQVPNLFPDNQGGGVYQWSTIATVWAQIKTVDKASYGSFINREMFEEGQLRSRDNFLVAIRYGPSVTTDMRVIYNGRDLEIESVVNVDELNWVTQLFCVERGKGEPQN